MLTVAGRAASRSPVTQSIAPLGIDELNAARGGCSTGTLARRLTGLTALGGALLSRDGVGDRALATNRLASSSFSSRQPPASAELIDAAIPHR